MSFGYVMDPKNNKKNPVDPTQTTFSENNNYQRANIGENKKKIIAENVSFQGYFTVVFLDKKTGCHSFKMAIFSKFSGDFMSHIIG